MTCTAPATNPGPAAVDRHPADGNEPASTADPVLAVRLARHAWWRGDAASLRVEALFGALNLAPAPSGGFGHDTIHF